MKGSKSLLLSCFLAFALVHSARAVHEHRALPVIDTGSSTGETSATSQTTSTSATTPTTTSTTSPTTSPSTTAPTTTPTSTPSTTGPTTTPTSTTTTSSQQSSKSSATTTQAQNTQASESVVVSTGPGGATTITQTLTGTDSSTSSSASPSSTDGADNSNSSSDDSSGLSTGSIIGLSVAGGIAALGIISFFIWKFTRKRFSDFDDTEAIKWPELNAHNSDIGDSHPLPVHNTGRAGFDTGSEVSLSRANSTTTHTNYSTADFGNDPYAVPPLPHLNPSQPGPYRDDPAAVGAYYDPYRGPVPGAFSEPNTATEWGPQAGHPGHPGEAYPMTQMAPGGRASPGPSMMMSGRASPGPAAMMTGRASPGPQAAYDNYGAR